MKKIFKLSVLGGVLLTFVLIPIIFQKSIEYNEFIEPKNTTTLISLGNEYNAFPKVIRVQGNTTNNGSTPDPILAVWYNGNAHVDTNGQGKIMGAISYNEGVKWQSPFIIYSDPKYDCRNVGITQAINGTLTLFFAKVAVSQPKSYSWVDFGYINSIDQGQTWSNFTSIQNQTGFAALGLISGNGYGDSLKFNSTQFILCYGSTNESVSENNLVFILRSDYNGTKWYLDGTLNGGTGISLNEADWWNSDGRIWGISRSEAINGSESMYYFEGIGQMFPLVYWVNGTNITYTEPPANSSLNVANFTQRVNYTFGFNWTKMIPTNFWGHSPDILRLQNTNKHLLIFRAKAEYNYYIGYKLLPATWSSVPISNDTFASYPTKCLVKTTYGQSKSDMAYPSAINIANQSVMIVYYDIGAGGIFARIIREADL